MCEESKESLRDKLRQLPVLKGDLKHCDFNTFPETPQDAFHRWIIEAVDAGVREPHAMTLSTVDEQQRPDARVLILKNVDSRGWHFAAKANSPKGQQIANTGFAALTFYWREIGRQVRIRGKVVQLPDEECAKDFTDRPLGSRVAALGSKQSQQLESKDELDKAVADAKEYLEATPDYISPDWKVYAVQANEVEFWQGSGDRLHQRLQYVAGSDGEWTKGELWP
jgi:pyridoxamine 5'-phosphate oxidase